MKKTGMTVKEWNAARTYLTNSGVGAYVEHNDRQCEVVELSGGRYMLLDEDNNIIGLTDSMGEIQAYLCFGVYGDSEAEYLNENCDCDNYGFCSGSCCPHFFECKC